MNANDVVQVLDALAAAGVHAWLDGGWAVDALLAEQTRVHDDLDLVTPLDESARLEQALNERGYTLAAGGPPLSFELVDTEGHQVDVHPVSWATNGDGVYRMTGGEDWIYPAHGFRGVGRIAGREAPCLTAEVVLVNHTTGYALDEAHQHDARALSERFGIPLPDFRPA